MLIMYMCPRRNTITLMTSITDSVVAFIFKHLSLALPTKEPLLEIARLKKESPQEVAAIPAFTLLLNLVKSKAEMTYELVMSLQTNIMDGTLSSDSLDEWESWVAVISESLEFLKGVVSEQQQHIILDMQASFFGSTGSTPARHTSSIATVIQYFVLRHWVIEQRTTYCFVML